MTSETLSVTARDGTRLHAEITGPADGRALVFANSLGSDLRLWDAVLAHLPPGLRVLRWDKRGHGRSDVPEPPYAMGTLVADAEAVIEAAGLRAVTFCGLSIGGMIAQGLAVKRPDLVSALVLSNTAAKIGTPAMWDARIETVLAEGMEPLADQVMPRWFGRDFMAGPDLPLWRARFCAVSPKGYAGCCAAIRGTDFYTPTSGLRLPTLAIAGSEDVSTPPDLVRETADLIPGARFELMRRAGHLPCVEQPAAYARLLGDFLATTSGAR
ncbi:3-oxoadipate enol-lactonase [Jannaschia marina]|uniref:3-oxoadipate enol-lactonase n=1 Tax=Jannaschia marina TaxID=2741674 RepID=UPI0015C74248|nr:3-oxoadipate enol-lactonase [Jannaschia marina]